MNGGSCGWENDGQTASVPNLWCMSAKSLVHAASKCLKPFGRVKRAKNAQI